MRLICAIFALAASLDAQPVKNDLICVTRSRNPSVEIWRKVREALEAKDGDEYAANLKGAVLPKLPATILEVNGDRYVGSVFDGKTADLVIRLTGPWKGKPLQVGTEVEFEGYNEAVTKEPFRIVLAVDPAKIKVLEKFTRTDGTISRCYTKP